MTRLYVASSWRNKRYPAVIERLRAEDIAHYDFRNPVSGNYGFSGSDVSQMLGFGPDGWRQATPTQIGALLDHPYAVDGFFLDKRALDDASAVLMVMPCGRSAHLELGWCVGRDLPSVILLDEDSESRTEAELMWKIADLVTPSLDEAVEFLKR